MLYTLLKLILLWLIAILVRTLTALRMNDIHAAYHNYAVNRVLSDIATYMGITQQKPVSTLFTLQDESCAESMAGSK